VCGFIRANSRYADSHACASFCGVSKVTVPKRPSRAMGPSVCDTECGRDTDGRCGACCDAGLREDMPDFLLGRANASSSHLFHHLEGGTVLHAGQRLILLSVGQ
jgi:hypothetical protein